MCALVTGVHTCALPVFLERLASIPTVVYGFFALLFVTPMLQQAFPSMSGFNALSAGLVMGVMILPYVSSLSEDALRAVPKSLREAAYGMGSTKFQTAFQIGRAHVCTPVTNAHLVCRLLLEKQKNKNRTHDTENQH